MQEGETVLNQDWDAYPPSHEEVEKFLREVEFPRLAAEDGKLQLTGVEWRPNGIVRLSFLRLDNLIVCSLPPATFRDYRLVTSLVSL